MTTQTIEKELVELETQFWEALKDKDVDTAVRLTHDPCIITGAQGIARVDRKTFEGMVTGAPWEITGYDFEDVQVELLTDDVAIVAYKVKEDLMVDGKPVKLAAADTSTWVRRDGQWRCALHTEAISGDPFGRDRTPTRGG